MQKKSQTHRTHHKYTIFTLGLFFFAFHSVVVFMITVCVFLSIIFWSLSPFNSLVFLPFVFRRITQRSNDIFVSKFGFKTPESPMNFDKITFDDSLTRQERRRKTLPRNYTHPKKSMVHATFCSLNVERYAQVSVWRQTTGWFGCINSGKVWFPKKLTEWQECREKIACFH